jgi:hypothetical protein
MDVTQTSILDLPFRAANFAARRHAAQRRKGAGFAAWCWKLRTTRQ